MGLLSAGCMWCVPCMHSFSSPACMLTWRQRAGHRGGMHGGTCRLAPPSACRSAGSMRLARRRGSCFRPPNLSSCVCLLAR